MKLLGFFAFAGLFTSQLLSNGEAKAAPRKGLSKKEGSKSGVLVAMDGSASLGLSSTSRKNYLGLRFFPYSIVSADIRAGNTTVETPESSWSAMAKEFVFSANFGEWVLRPEFDLSGQKFSFVSVGYYLNPQLELGGVLALERSTKENANKIKTVESGFLVGPQAVYYTAWSGLGLEGGGRVYIVSGSSETTNNNTTTTNRDVFGYGFEVAARLTSDLTGSLEYVGGISLAYQSTTDEANKNAEIKSTSFDFSIVPAGLRLKF